MRGCRVILAEVDRFAQSFGKIRQRSFQRTDARFELRDAFATGAGPIRCAWGTLERTFFFDHRLDFAGEQMSVFVVLAPGTTRQARDDCAGFAINQVLQH